MRDTGGQELMQRPAGTQQVTLPDELGQHARAHAIGQWVVGGAARVIDREFRLSLHVARILAVRGGL
jgi:hypothetical protein